MQMAPKPKKDRKLNKIHTKTNQKRNKTLGKNWPRKTYKVGILKNLGHLCSSSFLFLFQNSVLPLPFRVLFHRSQCQPVKFP